MIAYSTAVLTIFAFTFQSKTAGSTMDFTGLSSASSDTLVRDQIKQAETLRNIGKRYLSTRQYNKAATCYAAVLQVIEGVGGTESGELRRRCCLTLAECEIKTGNLYAAIARCTEVIEECPEVATVDLELDNEDDKANLDAENHLSDDHILRQVLGQAFYRRGVALSRLEEPDLALLDLQEASKQIPNDLKILERLETLESVILNHDRQQQQLSGVPTKLELEEQLQSIAEDAQANYQRAYFSRKEINDLLQKPSRNSNALSENNFMSMGQGGSKMGGLGDFFAGGIDPSLGGLGGLGGIANLLGSKSGDAAGMVSSLGMMLRMFSGLDNDTVGLLEEIAKAVLDVFQIFKKSFETIMKYRSEVIIFFSVCWTFFTLRTNTLSQK